MKVTIIYDNTAYKKELKADWGFSCLVEAFNRKILFDTGTDGNILLSNMKKLGIQPKDIQDIFISHYHLDHTGGLSMFLSVNNKVTLWFPPSFDESVNAKKIIKVNKPMKLYEGIYSTGELEGIEQSLCIQTKKGIVVIVGCSHPKIDHILQTASRFGRVYGIIGGLHGNSPEPLKNLDLICATHCTQYKSKIKSLYPEKYIEGGAGKIIEIE